jgi:hypothetical protein
VNPTTKARQIVLAALCILSNADAATPKLDVFQERGSNRQSIPDTQQKTSWSWITNGEKVREVRLRAVLRSNAFRPYTKVDQTSPTTKNAFKDGTLAILMSAVETKVNLTSSAKSGQFLIRYPNKGQSIIIDENCSQKFQVGLQAEEPTAPFFIGISCARDAKGLNVSLSYPSDVELVDASFSEAKGKGESWKYYELPPIQQTVSELGQFILSYQGKTYRFNLKSLRPQIELNTEDASVLHLGLGLSLLGIKGSDIEASTGSPTAVLRVPHYKLTGNLGLSAAVDFAIPISSGAGSVKFSQFAFFGSYVFNVGSRFSMAPKLGYVITSQSEELTAIGLSSSQPGFGVAFRYDLGPKYYLALEGLTAGIGSPVINSHYLFDLSLIRKKTSQYGWGLGAKMQNFSATSGLGVQRTFSQMLFYAVLCL